MESPQLQITPCHPKITLIVKPQTPPRSQPKVRLIVKPPTTNTNPSPLTPTPPSPAPAPPAKRMSRRAWLHQRRYKYTGVFSPRPHPRRRIRRTFLSRSAVSTFKSIFPNRDVYLLYRALAFPKSFAHWVDLVIQLSELAPEYMHDDEKRQLEEKRGRRHVRKLVERRLEFQSYLESSARVGLAQLGGLREELLTAIVEECKAEAGFDWDEFLEWYGLKGLRYKDGRVGRSSMTVSKRRVKQAYDLMNDAYFVEA